MCVSYKGNNLWIQFKGMLSTFSFCFSYSSETLQLGVYVILYLLNI